MSDVINFYRGDFGEYEIPAEILAAAGVTSARGLWDMRYASARRLRIWGRWMDQCAMNEALA